MDQDPVSPGAPESKISQADVQLIIAEYDRLKGLEASEWNTYHSRFNFFMTVVLALLGGYVTLATATSQFVSPGSPVPEILGTIVLVWGVLTFIGLVDSSYTIRHYINALNWLQKFFIDKNLTIRKYLYFRKESNPDLYRKTGWLEGLLAEYALRGSPKMVLALVNSAIITGLAAQTLYLRGAPANTSLAVGIMIGVASGIAHVIYVKLIYRRKYIA